MSEQAKQIIRKAIKRIFNFEFEDLMTTDDYLKLLEICKEAENLLIIDSLILEAIESLFIENGKFIEKIENDNAIKYLDYIIDKKSYNKETKKDLLNFVKGQKEFEDVFKDLKVTEKEMLIFKYICEIKKDINTIFDCINIFYSGKKPNYISSQKKFSFTGNFEVYFSQLKDTLQYHDFEKEKEYISLEYNIDDGFYFKEYSFEEAMKIKEKTEAKKPRKDVRKFIKAHLIINPKNDDYLNPNLQINNDESSLKQVIISQKDISQYNKNDSHVIKIIKKANENNYQDEINRLKEKFEEFQNNYLKLEKSHSELEKSHLELKKEHTEFVKVYKKELEKVKAELKLQKKIYIDNKRKEDLKHQYDINHLYNIIKKKEQNKESKIKQEKDKYNKLINKFDESNISQNELRDDFFN